MDYNRLSYQLRRNKLSLFTLRDIKNLFPGEEAKTIKNNLMRWVSKGYLVRLRRGVYEFSSQGLEASLPDVYVANRLYEPSYVSLETALSIYSIIPGVAAGVTSVTTRPTRAFKNRYGAFFYRTCRPRAFTGYRLVNYEGFKVRLADKEKALVDFIYYRLRSGFPPDFGNERFDKKLLKELNWKKVSYYAGFFNKRTGETLKKCEVYTGC